MTTAPFQTLGDAGYGDELRATRAAEAQVALKRLAHEIRSCRALGCAEAWKVTHLPHPTDPDTWILTLSLPSQAFADRLEETLHGAD